MNSEGKRQLQDDVELILANQLAIMEALSYPRLTNRLQLRQQVALTLRALIQQRAGRSNEKSHAHVQETHGGLSGGET